MKMWAVIIIMRIVFEIVKATRGKTASGIAVQKERTRIADPAAHGVRDEYLYRII
jgi:hypothetical protein